MGENSAAEVILTTVGSNELGLDAGTWADLDAVVSKLDRESLALRIVSVLTGLNADAAHGGRSVSLSLASALGEAHPLASALLKSNAVFVEPLQQLVLLRRCLTLAHAGEDISSDIGLGLYVDASRYTSDVLHEMLAIEAESEGQLISGDTALQVAAVFLLRMSLGNPPHVTNWIARLRLMLNSLPEEDSRAAVWAERLKSRIESTFGLTFDEVTRLTGILSLWSARFNGLEEVFKPDAGIALNLDTWLSKTYLPRSSLVRFFERTSLPVTKLLVDDELGGPSSILPFRDRPFIQFTNGNIAPIHPALVVEKLTYDLFWWSSNPSTPQAEPWQRDWGDLVEAYVVQVLRWIADATGCGLAADIQWEGGQMDAAMWFKGHVAVFEISAAMLRDSAAHGGKKNELRDALTRTLVRSSKPEAMAQAVRDAKAVLSGQLAGRIPVEKPTRVYPVVIAADRRIRTPGLRFWFDEAFEGEVGDFADRSRLGALAVWTLEDLEAVEELVRTKDPALNGTPRGVLRLLRTWQMTRDKLPKTGRKAGAWNHLVGHQIPVPSINARLKEEADRWWDDVKSTFKESGEVV